MVDQKAGMEELEHRFEIEVQAAEKKQRLPKEIKTELKAAGMMDDKGKIKLKGVSPKMLRKMKQEFWGLSDSKGRDAVYPVFCML